MVMRHKRVGAALAMVSVLAAALSACSSGGAQPASNVIDVSDTQCGGTWSVPGPGWHTLQISNQGVNGAEIDLVDPANGAVYAELENTGPGTVNPLSIDFGSGKYALLCLFNDSSPAQGKTVSVPGNAAGTQAVPPVTFNDLVPLAKKYATEEETALKALATQTATLDAAVHSGNLQAARRDWLTAHLQYETLGDAYSAFGAFDTEIDGRADPTGVTSSPSGSNTQWTGFYRLEYGLWHGQPMRELTPVADTLNTDVKQLVVWWPKQEVPLADLGRRAHEVIENALEFQLTGHDDYGSGTTLASTASAVTASRALLALLNPLLVTRYRGLPSVYSGLGQLQSLLDKEQLKNGWWVSVADLPTADKQAIDAAAGQLLQALAPIATITEPRNTAHGF
jgi:iron uptake system EfeUOB component EfeO/EfeM